MSEESTELRFGTIISADSPAKEVRMYRSRVCCLYLDVITSGTPFSCPVSTDVDDCMQYSDLNFLSFVRLCRFGTR